MAGDLEALYRRSPVAVQHAMATAFGVRERALRHGGGYRAFTAELDRDQWLAADELQAVQDRRLRAMVSFCATAVPHWRDLFARLRLAAGDLRTAADLAALPVLEKEEVRAAPQRFRPEHPTERLITWTTGGTTGTPLRCSVVPSAVQYNAAAYEVRFRRWAGIRPGARMASINGRVIVPIEQRQPPFWRRNLAFNQLYLSGWHLTPDNLPSYVERLARFAPEVIVGYVSTVHVLARHLLDHGRAGELRPRAVLVSSETLFPWLRDDIEAAFGCRVFNGYSLNELTAFVSECPAGSMHVSPEYGVIEAMAGPGDAHELVTTGLFNRAMPLLRYRTGDLVRPAPTDAGACPCGRHLPVLGEIVGRVDDRVVTPEGGVVGPAALSLAFQASPGLRQAQVVQDSAEEVHVLLRADAGFGPAEEVQLRGALRSRLGPTIAITFERVADIPRTSAGKERLIVSRLSSRHPLLHRAVPDGRGRRAGPARAFVEGDGADVGRVDGEGHPFEPPSGGGRLDSDHQLPLDALPGAG